MNKKFIKRTKNFLEKSLVVVSITTFVLLFLGFLILPNTGENLEFKRKENAMMNATRDGGEMDQAIKKLKLEHQFYKKAIKIMEKQQKAEENH